jgi:hypothetical protein
MNKSINEYERTIVLRNQLDNLIDAYSDEEYITDDFLASIANIISKYLNHQHWYFKDIVYYNCYDNSAIKKNYAEDILNLRYGTIDKIIKENAEKQTE